MPRGARPCGAAIRTNVTDQNGNSEQASDSKSGQPTISPLQSRFLFVDIAALRAKQLRRGALPRIEKGPNGEPRPDAPKKPERVAMEEVRNGLVTFEMPDLKAPVGGPIS